MAADAKIQRVEELMLYSNCLGNFLESISKNMNAFDCIMMQKLESLRKIKLEAEEIEKNAIAECSDCERTLAYCPASEVERRRELSIRYREAEHKKLLAQKTRDEVSSLYNVAQGSIRCMLDNTKIVKKHMHSDIEKGRDLLKKASQNLDDYKKTKSV